MAEAYSNQLFMKGEDSVKLLILEYLAALFFDKKGLLDEKANLKRDDKKPPFCFALPWANSQYSERQYVILKCLLEKRLVPYGGRPYTVDGLPDTPLDYVRRRIEELRGTGKDDRLASAMVALAVNELELVEGVLKTLPLTGYDRLISIRNDLFANLPAETPETAGLLRDVKWHLNSLDTYIFNQSSLENEVKRHRAKFAEEVKGVQEPATGHATLLQKYEVLHHDYRKLLQASAMKEGKAQELLTAYKEYQQLLVEEIEEILPLAVSHGWGSSRVEEGQKIRQKIEQLTEGLSIGAPQQPKTPETAPEGAKMGIWEFALTHEKCWVAAFSLAEAIKVFFENAETGVGELEREDRISELSPDLWSGYHTTDEFGTPLETFVEWMQQNSHPDIIATLTY